MSLVPTDNFSLRLIQDRYPLLTHEDAFMLMDQVLWEIKELEKQAYKEALKQELLSYSEQDLKLLLQNSEGRRPKLLKP